LEELTNLCRADARRRLELEPPPNDYATFKKEHMNRTLWTEHESADLEDEDPRLRRPLANFDRTRPLFEDEPSAIKREDSHEKSRAEVLFCELMDKILDQKPPSLKNNLY
jgi:hypothetical protein